MKINTEPIKNWFGFTRRERRASFVLMLIVILVLSLRVAVPEKNIEIKDITDSLSLNDVLSELNTKEAVIKEKPIKYKRAVYDTVGRYKKIASKPKKQLINLNNCDTAQLISLPGIGPVLSVRIIKYRNLLGGYASVSQLNEVYGLPPETFELIKERVYADTTLLTQIKINSAGFKELSKLPYFEKYEVQAILKYREIKGRIGGVNELVYNKLIPAEKGIKVKPYLKFE